MFTVACMCLIRKMSEHDAYGDLWKTCHLLIFRKLDCGSLVLVIDK